MRSMLIASVLIGAAGCATTAPQPQATASTAMCLPCVLPCTPESSCGSTQAATVVPPAPVAKPTPVPAVATAPAPAAAASREVGGEYTVSRPATPRVAVTSDRLELTDKIYFDTSKATIKPASYGLLDEVATALESHDVKRAEIQGHTDSSGDATFNKQLSQQRAEAVRDYLVGKGIDASRLEPKGFGAEKPVAPNTSTKGREANRRVEFKIAD